MSEVKARKSHIFERDKHDHYVEPLWPTLRLLETTEFEGPILDPACGWGRIPMTAMALGYDVIGSDVVNRCRVGIYPFDFRKIDFLGLQHDPTYEWWREARSIVSNPPFGLFRGFTERALSLMFKFGHDGDKVAFIWLAARLNAADWLKETPLRHILYLTPRPSMPPGDHIRAVERGEIDPKTGKPKIIGCGKANFVWLIWEKDYTGEPSVGWLHRDE